MNKKLKKLYVNSIKDLLLSTFYRKKTKFRTEEFVRDAYEESYGPDPEDLYRVFLAPQNNLNAGIPELAPVIDYKAYLIKKFSRLIELYRIDSLLEIGSGRGLNLLALAALHPELKKIRGVELTASGVAHAKAHAANPPLFVLKIMTGLPEEVIRERLAGRDIDYVQGSARALPFETGSFKGVFSNAVIEQFPRDYLLPFSEAYRVSSDIGFFCEPFRESQRNIFQLLYLRSIDYFRAPFDAVKKAGWHIIGHETPLLQKMLFSTSILVCKKNRV